MLEFVDSGLYFVQDENNFISQLLQVGSDGPKINGSDRIQTLIPGSEYLDLDVDKVAGLPVLGQHGSL